MQPVILFIHIENQADDWSQNLFTGIKRRAFCYEHMHCFNLVHALIIWFPAVYCSVSLRKMN